MKIGFLPLLFLVFLTLKLTAVIDWSWWWVSAPIWIPLAISAFCMTLAGVAFLMMSPQDRKIVKAQRALKNYADALRKHRQ